MQNISSAAFTDTKPHYDLLDGLRGVAALLVVWYHVYEGYAPILAIWPLISFLSYPASLSAMLTTTVGQRV